jgi:hypothetical protein
MRSSHWGVKKLLLSTWKVAGFICFACLEQSVHGATP